MRIVIFGGCGFLGSSLTEYLLNYKGYEVVVIDSVNRNSVLKGLNISKFIHIDYPYIDFKKIIENIKEGDIFIHLGWYNTPRSSINTLEQSFECNIRFNISLFTSLIEKKIRKIIFASSGGAIYGKTEVFPTNELVAANPISPYGIEKLATEHYLKLLFNDANIQYIILRLSNPYGYFQIKNSTQIGLIANFIRSIKNKTPIEIWGDGSTSKDYIFISDITEAMYKAIINEKIYGVYNVGSGVGVSINELLNIIEEKAKTKISIKWSQRKDFDIDKVVLDSTLFSKEVNWLPKISLEKGVTKMIKKALR